MIVEFLLSLIVSLSFSSIVLLITVRKLKLNIDKLKNDNIKLQEPVNYIDGDIHTQNFIKFLSDSREAAFEYIYNTQKQIKEFIEVADKQFAFFDSYGMLTEGQLYYDNMKTLSDEYKKLKLLLPEDSI